MEEHNFLKFPSVVDKNLQLAVKYICELAKGGEGTVHLFEVHNLADPKRRRAAKSILAPRGYVAKVIKYADKKAMQADNQTTIMHKCSDHPGVARVLQEEVFQESLTRIIIMREYTMQLDDYLQLVRNNSNFTPILKIIVYQILKVLEHLEERGAIHCDIKPSNIMMDEQSNPIVLDFGFAVMRSVNMLDSNKKPWLGGTPEFLPMECLLRAVDYTTKADLFAVGVILYEVLTGKQLNPMTSARSSQSMDEVLHSSITGLVRKLGYPSRRQLKHLRATPDFAKSKRLLQQPFTLPPCTLRRQCPRWEADVKGRISPVGLQFMRGLLDHSPRNRMSVKQALDHPWLADARDALSRKGQVFSAKSLDISLERQMLLESRLVANQMLSMLQKLAAADSANNGKASRDVAGHPARNKAGAGTGALGKVVGRLAAGRKAACKQAENKCVDVEAGGQECVDQSGSRSPAKAKVAETKCSPENKATSKQASTEPILDPKNGGDEGTVIVSAVEQSSHNMNAVAAKRTGRQYATAPSGELRKPKMLLHPWRRWQKQPLDSDASLRKQTGRCTGLKQSALAAGTMPAWQQYGTWGSACGTDVCT